MYKTCRHWCVRLTCMDAIVTSQNPRERAKFWRAADLGDLELLRATYITHTFDRHMHEGYAIGVIESGAETYWYRGAYHTVGAGQVVVVEPGEIHTGQATDGSGWTYKMLYPGVTLMRQIAHEMTGEYWTMPHFSQTILDDPHLAMLIRSLHATLERSPLAMERAEAARDAFGYMLMRYGHNHVSARFLSRPQQAIDRARDYIRAHYAENISLDTLSNIAGISPYHLARMFQRQVGLPPHSYLTHVRVEHAKTMLGADIPLAEVALAVGFTDQSHLTRRFKRIVGVTPGQFH